MSAIVIERDLSVIRKHHFLESRPELEVYECADVVPTLEELPSPTALLTANRCWEDRYLSALTGGDWVSTIGSGYENVALEALEEANVAFTNTPGVAAPQMAEHVFAMVFSHTRNLEVLRKQQRERTWVRPSYTSLTDMAGETCCVVGIGRIGEAVAKRAKAFDMTVRGVKRSPAEYEGVADAVYASDALESALEGAKLVVISTPLTDQTHHLIGKTQLDAADDNAIVVNIGRGPVLETDALIAALDEGSINFACLDVTDPEPLPGNSPLWEREDVFISPHSSARSDKYASRLLERYLAQYDRWTAGEELRDRVV